METLLILAAATVAVLALAFVWVTAARDRRPELRTRQEEEITRGDPEGLIAAITPAPASPIDREALTLEIASIEAALRETRLFEDHTGAGRVLDGEIIEGHPVDARLTDAKLVEAKPVADGAADGVLASETKAYEWKPAQTDEPAEPRSDPRRHGRR